MKHSDLITLIYKHRDLINRAFDGELIEDVPKELIKEIPIFQEVAKKYELNDNFDGDLLCFYCYDKPQYGCNANEFIQNIEQNKKIFIK